MTIIAITEKNFDEMVEKHDFLVIDFWATWCAPCKSFTKVIENVSEKYPEFTFGSIDIDKEKALAEEFKIRSIPAIMILRNKVVVYAESGALSDSSLSDLLEQAKALDPADL